MKNRDVGEILSLFNSSSSITISTLTPVEYSNNESDFMTNSNKLIVNNEMALDIIMLLQLTGKDVQLIKFVNPGEHSKIAILTCNAINLKCIQSTIDKKGFRFSGKRQWSKLKNWIKETSNETSIICFHVPLVYGTKKNEYHIHYRKNTGEDLRIFTENLNECARNILELKNLKNHMICVEENGERILRWDKEITFDSNKWKSCPPDEVEIIGKIPLIRKLKT